MVGGGGGLALLNTFTSLLSSPFLEGFLGEEERFLLRLNTGRHQMLGRLTVEEPGNMYCTVQSY